MSQHHHNHDHDHHHAHEDSPHHTPSETHGHHHGHHHHHGSRNLKILAFAVILTLGFAAIEALSGWLANSLALLSDAGHMAADSLSLVLAAIAAWISTKPPSKSHSYGLGRAEVLGAWISSILILIVIIAISIEAIERLRSPENVSGGTVMLVASIGVLINLLIAYILSKGDKSLNIRAAILHVLGDLLGSFSALIAGAVIYFTHWTAIDPILSIFICILILVASIRLLRESLLILMEGVPKYISIQAVREKILAAHGVDTIHDLHIWNLASGSTVLSAHVEIDEMGLWPQILEQLKQTLKATFNIDHITIQPESHTHILQKAEKPKHL